MRKEIFRMPREPSVALLAAAPYVHLATTDAAGRPVLRALNAAVADGALLFHGAPAGEKSEAVGRDAVVSAEQVVASIPSYFVDPRRACPATTLYRSVQVHGTLEEVTDPARKAAALRALLAKHQPEGGFVPVDHADPLYAKTVAGLLVLAVSLERVDGKAKLGQNRTPQERARMLEHVWRRGALGDARAVDLVLDACDDTPLPAFVRGPHGLRLRCALGPADAGEAARLLEGEYWNDRFTREELARAHAGSVAWVGARDGGGALVASARAISDGAKHAWVYDVVVAPAWRGRRLGDAVVRLLLDHPAVRGARFVHLGTRDAQGFYARLGFRPREELPPRPYASTTMTLAR